MDYKKVIVYWKELEIPEVKERKLKIELPVEDLIITITGPRRTGKTYYCFQLMNDLKKEGINQNNILYINFEDERLFNANSKDLDQILDLYLETYEPQGKQKIFLFFDEIQNVNNWDGWVRRINDTNKNIQFVLTGSSSKQLSREIATKLRGRTINFEIYPLSFSEYLEWKGITYNLRTVRYSSDNKKIKTAFLEYLRNGGFPKVVLGEQWQDKLLQTYYEVMLLRDIIERHNIRNINQLKILSKLLFNSVSSEFSYNKLKNKMLSIGLDISKNTII